MTLDEEILAEFFVKTQNDRITRMKIIDGELEKIIQEFAWQLKGFSALI